MATTVIFRRFKHDGEIIALFPEEPGSNARLCMSYLHQGQHGDADHDVVVENTRPATVEEAAVLIAELRSIGYTDLRVRRNDSPKMRATRAEAYYRLLKNPL